MATYTTKQQKAVLDCLSERADSPVSAAAIVDALREQGEHIGIATVYRQLEKLERQGSVHKVTTDEGAYYQFCTHGCASDCCLFKCERCGRIVHLDCHQLAPLYEHLEHIFPHRLHRACGKGGRRQNPDRRDAFPLL